MECNTHTHTHTHLSTVTFPKPADSTQIAELIQGMNTYDIQFKVAMGIQEHCGNEVESTRKTFSIGSTTGKFKELCVCILSIWSTLVHWISPLDSFFKLIYFTKVIASLS